MSKRMYAVYDKNRIWAVGASPIAAIDAIMARNDLPNGVNPFWVAPMTYELFRIIQRRCTDMGARFPLTGFAEYGGYLMTPDAARECKRQDDLEPYVLATFQATGKASGKASGKAADHE